MKKTEAKKIVNILMTIKFQDAIGTFIDKNVKQVTQIPGGYRVHFLNGCYAEYVGADGVEIVEILV